MIKAGKAFDSIKKAKPIPINTSIERYPNPRKIDLMVTSSGYLFSENCSNLGSGETQYVPSIPIERSSFNTYPPWASLLRPRNGVW